MSNSKYAKRSDFHEPIQKLFDRLPPSATEAEMSLLGSMIVAGAGDIHIIADVIGILSGPDDFEKPSHQALYQVLIDLYDRNRSLDSVQIIQELRTRSLLEQVGGADYVIQLAESVPIAENAPYYAGLVQNAAKRRGLIRASTKILRDAYESPDPINELMDRAEQAIFDIAQGRQEVEPQRYGECVNEAYRLLDARHEDGVTLTGLDTGFHELNDMLSGLQKSELVIIAGRPSMGKTAIALNLIQQISFNGKQPSAIFSLEMSKQQLTERLLSSTSGVDAQRMKRNMLTADEFRRLQEAISIGADAPFYIDDSPGMTIMQLRAKARRLASRKDIKGVFVDYMQLMSCPGAENRQQEVSQISRQLKALAKELAIPVIALAQLNRNSEGRRDNRPLLSDLRESGSIEQDADVVMLLHREEYYHKDEAWRNENPQKLGVAEIIIAKQRNGPTGTIELVWRPEVGRFENKAPAYVPELSQLGF